MWGEKNFKMEPVNKKEKGERERSKKTPKHIQEHERILMKTSKDHCMWAGMNDSG
jgi:hypothetical protein